MSNIKRRIGNLIYAKSVRLTLQHVRIAARLGAGCVSTGIRNALEHINKLEKK